MERRKLTYRHTMKACFLANFLQSSGAMFSILFIPLKTLYGITYTQFAVLLSINFITQVVSDVCFSKPVEKYGFRIFAVGSPILSASGIFLFAAAPVLLPGDPFPCFCVGMFVFAASAGLQELLLSPIMDALPVPEKEKAKSMSMLHSCFAWGQIVCVLITTLFVFFADAKYWQVIACFWGAVPLINIFLFARVPLYERVSSGKAMKVRELMRNKLFLLILAAIITGGSGEVVMSQWASAFIERGMELPKIIGDMVGVCGFSFLLAMGRTAYGIWGDKCSIHKVMILGALGGTICYVLAAISSNPYVGITACILTGICVSLLWPGSIVIAAREFPTAGAAMFALLSAGGDVGASAGSFLIGRVADSITPEQIGLRTGLLIAAAFPALCAWINFVIKQKTEHK